MRQLLQVFDERLYHRDLVEIVCDLIDRQRLDLGLGDAVDSAGHQRADRLGGAPLEDVKVTSVVTMADIEALAKEI